MTPTGHQPRAVSAAQPDVITVGELGRRVRSRLEGAHELQSITVEGEVSNLFEARSGHLYMTLKDADACVKVVMWASRTGGIVGKLSDGAQVLVSGGVSSYPARGEYQLVATRIVPAGEGLLWARYAELKARLEKEGLFDPATKRSLPRFARRIGVVTSRDGAALHDILHVLERRAPYVEVLVADARVQGADATTSIVRALRRMANQQVDVVIVGRGGGSLEDLWAFNEEDVVRAVAAFPLPIVSAVGHETDVLLSDLAADVRAPTPSAAAEVVVPALADLHQRLDGLERQMARCLTTRLDHGRLRLEALGARPLFRRPDGLFLPVRERLGRMEQTAQRCMEARLERAGQQVARAAGLLDALSPLKVLGRGFAVARVGGHAVRSVRSVSPGDRMQVRLADGDVDTKVVGVKQQQQDESKEQDA